MIYLDSSVALADILTEARRPPRDFWQQPFASSRLLQLEVLNRLFARRAGPYRLRRAEDILDRVELLELTEHAVARALQPFPVPVRTLDGLHLAAMSFLRERGAPLTLASYDARLIAAAQALGFGTVRP
ncbi:PIN domain-containing protein [Enterovirga sp. CN4-39]|uniref:PIN domain-containing protein n=1 Tax=Enterovirga sp. CN4-39 TaxID=3400910 RepID=UPI003C11DE3D